MLAKPAAIGQIVAAGGELRKYELNGQGETIDASTCRIGFRCILRKPPAS
jgi:hypothetical protein